jgi:hypothetical protein
VGPGLRRALPGVGAGPPADRQLLDERQRPRFPVHGAGRAFAAHLSRINPGFDRSWITGAWSFAAPFAQPIVTAEYKDHIPPFSTPVPGLWVASMFQVYPHDRGQNYSIDLANRLVGELPA